MTGLGLWWTTEHVTTALLILQVQEDINRLSANFHNIVTWRNAELHVTRSAQVHWRWKWRYTVSHSFSLSSPFSCSLPSPLVKSFQLRLDSLISERPSRTALVIKLTAYGPIGTILVWMRSTTKWFHYSSPSYKSNCGTQPQAIIEMRPSFLCWSGGTWKGLRLATSLKGRGCFRRTCILHTPEGFHASKGDWRPCQRCRWCHLAEASTLLSCSQRAQRQRPWGWEDVDVVCAY